MNPKLKFIYKNIDIPGWKGRTCEVEIEGIENSRFISLDLLKNQIELTLQQVQWFEIYGNRVVEVCEAAKVADINDLTSFRIAINNKFAMMNKFCKDCKIKDS